MKAFVTLQNVNKQYKTLSANTALGGRTCPGEKLARFALEMCCFFVIKRACANLGRVVPSSG